MEDVGYALGPAFQKLLEAESLSGTRNCRSIVSLREPPSAFAQSNYQMHPTSVDGILQTCGPALWNGNRTNMNAVIIPANIDDIVICPQPNSTTTGMAVVSSSYTGLGDPNETKNYTVCTFRITALLPLEPFWAVSLHEQNPIGLSHCSGKIPLKYLIAPEKRFWAVSLLEQNAFELFHCVEKTPLRCFIAPAKTLRAVLLLGLNPFGLSH